MTDCPTRDWRRYASVLCLAVVIAQAMVLAPTDCHALGTDPASISLPWEALLWGGEEVRPKHPAVDSFDPGLLVAKATPDGMDDKEQRRMEQRFDGAPMPAFSSGYGPATTISGCDFPCPLARNPFRSIQLRNIPPLYTNTKLPGEGIWRAKDMPSTGDGWPAIYATCYRPSVTFPNATVHMLTFDMKQISMRLYIGSGEPGANEALSKVESEQRHYLLAVTNALWKAKHSGGGGSVFRGKVITKLVPGLASVVVFKDGRVDVVEWDDSIPMSEVLDVRQLKHLIVKDGRVVDTVVKNGKKTDAEIGMGMLLNEEQPTTRGWYGDSQMNSTSGDYWFIATRSAFGIRADGNLVFAVGHHIGTKDLAKALVLAGCVRAIHGDANPDNVLGNLYYTDAKGNVLRKAKLSPEQRDETLNRYLDRTYTSDFFAFYKKTN